MVGMQQRRWTGGDPAAQSLLSDRCWVRTGCPDPSPFGTLLPSSEEQRTEYVVVSKHGRSCSHVNIQQRPVPERLSVVHMTMVWYDSGEPSVLLAGGDELLFGQRVDGAVITTRILTDQHGGCRSDVLYRCRSVQLFASPVPSLLLCMVCCPPQR